MDLVCDPPIPNNNPLTKRQKEKVRNKVPYGTSEYMTAKVIRAAPGQRCSCCGGLRCAPPSCNLIQVPEEIQSLICDKNSLSCKTESCEETELPCKRVEEVCAKRHSWVSCDNRIEDEAGYSKSEISCFVKIIEQTLRDSLNRGGEPLVCGNNFTACGASEARDYCGSCLVDNDHGASFTGDVCAASLTCVSLDRSVTNDSWVQCCSKETVCRDEDVSEESVKSSKEPGPEPVKDICGSYKSIVSQHTERYWEFLDVFENERDFESRLAKLDFKIDDIGRSEEVIKWGALDVVDQVLAKQIINLERSQLKKNVHVCKTKDKFDELDRFSRLDKKGFATLCRQLFRWSYRLSKKWGVFTSQPHVVIHLPSIGYPFRIRRRAMTSFNFLQNIQVIYEQFNIHSPKLLCNDSDFILRKVTRLGWLANENARVLYIFPSNQSLEMIELFRDLIKNVRPDVTEDRLWIIRPDRKECLKIQCLNGSRALYQNSKTYRRVKMLTAGCQAFIVPGVMEEIDVFIAAELRTPIMGPPLEFQNHFLNKSKVAGFLKKIKVNQPPFVSDIYDFSELCQGLARLMIAFPKYVTWLIKINYGFNGLQTASISFEKSFSREIITVKKSPCVTTQKELTLFLMEILPGEMIFNKKAYKSCTEFCCDLQKYGGLVQACPHVNYRVLSLGVFVEHDTATPKVCASADIFRIPRNLTTDLVYGIPQATTDRLPLENLAVNVGIALREWQYIGYFGLDVVVLEDGNSADKFFVIDIDPHYTDVIAFTDWVSFCLKVASRECHCCQSRISHEHENVDQAETSMKKSKLPPKKIANQKDTMERYAICSGKLYSNGLAKYCGTTLVSLCEERNLRYNSEIKQGSMICPIDSERCALGLVSLYSTRLRAIDEFAKGLRVLHELSLEKHNNKIKTNMLELARALERLELGKTGNRKKNDGRE